MDSQSVPVEPIVRARFLVDRGLALFGRGQVEEATRCWKAALAYDPGNRRAQEYLQFVEAECGIDTTRIEVDPEAFTLAPEPIGPPRASQVPQYIPNPPLAAAPEAAAPEAPTPEAAAPEAAAPEAPAPEAPAPEAPAPGPPKMPLDVTYSRAGVADSLRAADTPDHEPGAHEVTEPPAPEAPETETQVPGPAGAPAAAGIPAPHLPGSPLSTADSEVEPLLAEIRRRLDHDDFSGVLEAAEEVLERFPDHADALQAREHATAHLVQMLEASLGGLDAVPAVKVPADEVIWLNLSHREGFVLSQVDGAMRYEDILDVCGMPRIEALRVLVHLRKDGVIGPA